MGILEATVITFLFPFPTKVLFFYLFKREIKIFFFFKDTHTSLKDKCFLKHFFFGVTVAINNEAKSVDSEVFEHLSVMFRSIKLEMLFEKSFWIY